jgi:hypothetical protein
MCAGEASTAAGRTVSVVAIPRYSRGTGGCRTLRIGAGGCRPASAARCRQFGSAQDIRKRRRTAMVRKGSPVRVRQRASQAALQRASQAALQRGFLVFGAAWVTTSAPGKGSPVRVRQRSSLYQAAFAAFRGSALRPIVDSPLGRVPSGAVASRNGLARRPDHVDGGAAGGRGPSGAFARGLRAAGDCSAMGRSGSDYGRSRHSERGSHS